MANVGGRNVYVLIESDRTLYWKQRRLLGAYRIAAVFVGGCRFGELPGTMQENGVSGPKWQILDPRCQLKPLLPAYLGRPQLGNDSSGG